jgi:hypothetical protein
MRLTAIPVAAASSTWLTLFRSSKSAKVAEKNWVRWAFDFE